MFKRSHDRSQQIPISDIVDKLVSTQRKRPVIWVIHISGVFHTANNLYMATSATIDVHLHYLHDFEVLLYWIHIHSDIPLLYEILTWHISCFFYLHLQLFYLHQYTPISFADN